MTAMADMIQILQTKKLVAEIPATIAGCYAWVVVYPWHQQINRDNPPNRYNVVRVETKIETWNDRVQYHVDIGGYEETSEIQETREFSSDELDKVEQSILEWVGSIEPFFVTPEHRYPYS